MTSFQFLKSEKDYNPWNIALEQMEVILNRFEEQSNTHILLKNFYADITQNIVETTKPYEIKPRNFADQNLVENLRRLLVKIKLPSIIHPGIDIFKNWMIKGIEIPGEFTVAYRLGIEYGGDKEFNPMFVHNV